MKKLFNYFLILVGFVSIFMISLVGDNKKIAKAQSTGVPCSLQRVGTEANGVEIWETKGDWWKCSAWPGMEQDPLTIPVGGYGNGVSADLISLILSNNISVKMLGHHSFYNLTVKSGSNIFSGRLVAGTDYTIGNGYPLKTSAQNKKLDIDVYGTFDLQGALISTGGGFQGGWGERRCRYGTYANGSCVWRNEYTYSFQDNGRGHGPGGGQQAVPHAADGTILDSNGQPVTTENDHRVAGGGGLGGAGAAGYTFEDCVYGNPPSVIPDDYPDGGAANGSVGTFGSGGGYATHAQFNEYGYGGRGGGVIDIEAKKFKTNASSTHIIANGDWGVNVDGEVHGGGGSGGSVSLKFIEAEGQMGMPTAKAGTAQTLCGTNYLARNGVVSTQVQTSNFLLTDSGAAGITADGGGTQVGAGAGGGGYVSIQQFSALTGNLTANPNFGSAPLNVNLNATAQGSDGKLNYTFWFNCGNDSNSVASTTIACGNPTDPAIGVKFDNISDLSKSVSHTYASQGTFFPKVIIERGIAVPAESRTTVVVNSSKPLVCGKYGDVNNDGKISQADGTLIYNFLNTGGALTDDQKKRADVDNSGSVTQSDNQMISDYLAGTVTTFNVCNLGASLVAKPNSGYAPLSVELQGTANNIAPNANSTYYFWWNCNNSSTNYEELATACGAPDNNGNQSGIKLENVSGASPAQKTIHQYAVGTFKPKLLIVRDGELKAQSSATVTVTEKPVVQDTGGGTIVFQGGNEAKAITIRGSLVSDKIEFNSRKKDGLGIKSRFSISVYNDSSVLNAHLPIFDGIMDVVVK